MDVAHSISGQIALTNFFSGQRYAVLGGVEAFCSYMTRSQADERWAPVILEECTQETTDDELASPSSWCRLQSSTLHAFTDKYFHSGTNGAREGGYSMETEIAQHLQV
jgi:hypothetical protein